MWGVETVVSYWKRSKVIECAGCYNLSKLKEMKKGINIWEMGYPNRGSESSKSENIGKGQNFVPNLP